MKKLFYILPMVAALLCGCKVDKWMDWKMQNEMWMAANAKNEGIQTTASGLQYRILYAGNTTDAKPDNASVVIVTYTAKLINGYQVDSGVGASIGMSGVVDGFAEGLKKIHAHGDIELFVPWNLAYKEEGSGTEGSLSGTFIPPYSTIIFKVHLNAVTK